MKLLIRLKDFRLQRYESVTRELIGPSCEMTASKHLSESVGQLQINRLTRSLNPSAPLDTSWPI
ncbi:hypothetical protein EYF80_049408 [Liparis tanakae]|uniref:Uncharacterized protein n=1 Tax=Liparis tanakae TaxID=230148 RepID=A0A4Z2FHM8_9TELE|nr:hypothetical protein EYF80_049408 [Liparis tanakae]